MQRLFVPCFLMMALFLWPGLCRGLESEADPFPMPQCIQPNVNFWVKVYSEYHSGQGIIHDNQDLDIVYGVVEIENQDRPGAGKINKARIKAAKKYYQTLLERLARGGVPSGPEEQRVADLFGPDAKPADFRRSAHRIRCQVGQKDRFREGLIRSGAYLDEIKQIFREHGLPVDLAYLPHVESSFNPDAYSKFGAAGAWQFTRSTGKQYMTVGYTVDERRDPIRSSHAAARLLKSNYEKLRDWPMAITAYNHGAAGMMRAQRKMGSYAAIFKNYRSRIFRFASRNFYSEFLAAREVAKNYHHHFGDLELQAPLKTTAVKLAGFVALPQLAQQLDVDMDLLRKLNPALRQPVFTGQKYAPKGYHLRLPADEERNWENLMADLPPEVFRYDQKHGRLYTVRRGDTAGDIARLHGIRLTDLMAANDLDRRATVYVNQNLRIPLPEDSKPQLAAHPETRKTALAQVASPPSSDVDGQTTIDALVQKVAAPSVPKRIGTIIASSTMPTIEEFPVSIMTPAADDHLGTGFGDYPITASLIEKVATVSETSDPVPGSDPAVMDSELTQAEPALAAEENAVSVSTNAPESENLPVSDPASAGAGVLDPKMVIGNLSITRVVLNKYRPVGIIQVEIEETIGHYAEWLGVRASEIRHLNAIPYGQVIHIGQQLKIPLRRTTKEAFEEQRFEYHKELVEDFFSTYRVEAVQIYCIKKGDTLWTLANEEFELPLWLIRRYNPDTDLATLVPSRNLRIPVVEKAI
jgi:membrane-bound lytic murein transglycosylase D